MLAAITRETSRNVWDCLFMDDRNSVVCFCVFFDVFSGRSEIRDCVGCSKTEFFCNEAGTAYAGFDFATTLLAAAAPQ